MTVLKLAAQFYFGIYKEKFYILLIHHWFLIFPIKIIQLHMQPKQLERTQKSEKKTTF